MTTGSRSSVDQHAGAAGPAPADDPSSAATPRGRYRCIMADPPWLERGGGKSRRGADRHYPLMPTKDIAALRVDTLADPAGCHLWLWATNNFLLDGLSVMEAWGFRYVTNLVWRKLRHDGQTALGMGQYLRGAHELCLFGVRGSLGPGGTPYGQAPFPVVPSVVTAMRAAHSVKPLEVRQAIETISPGPRIELFARVQAPGWSVLGNESDGRDIRDVLGSQAALL